MRDTVTAPDVLTQLERLCFAFGKPFGTPIKNMADEYAKALRRHGIPRVALEAGVDEAIGAGKRFPSVADLIERAKPHIPPTDGERQSWHSDTCPSCGVESFYAGYHFAAIAPMGRSGFRRDAVVLPRLRCRCPNPDPSWYTAEALAWAETDPAVGYRKPRDYATNPTYRWPANHGGAA